MQVSGFFGEVGDLVLEDEEVRFALTGEAEHIAVVVFDESAESLPVDQLQRDGALLFCEALEVRGLFVGGLGRRRFLFLRIRKRHVEILRLAGQTCAGIDAYGIRICRLCPVF